MALSDIFSAARDIADETGEKAGDILHNKTVAGVKIPVVAGIIVGLLAVVAIVTAFVVSASRPKAAPQQAAAEIFEKITIPESDLFLLDETDQIPPGPLLEMEKRSVWTVEDAENFWTNGESGFEGSLQKRVSDTIDLMLEKIP